MRTPIEYTNNLKKKIITENMLADSLLSVNERAKNMRDKRDEYRYTNDPYNNFEKYEEKMNHYYNQKNILLSILTPLEKIENKLYKNYDFCICSKEELEYDNYGNNEAFEEPKKYDYVTERIEERIEYDFETETKFYTGEKVKVTSYYKNVTELKDINYYLVYKIGEATFNKPIDKEEFENADLPLFKEENLKGEINSGLDLISVQFVNKVVDLIASENFIFKSEEKTKHFKF